MKLTKEQVQKLLPGETLTVACRNVAEVNSNYEVAMNARLEQGIMSSVMPISRSAKTLTVVVRRIETRSESKNAV